MNTRVLFRWTLSIVVAVGLLGVIGLALNPPVQARAATVYDWPGQSPCDASLQQCINAAAVLPGDIIHIRPGVYVQSVTLAKPVSLVGDNRSTTILQAPFRQRVLTVTGTLTSTTVISGLTFQGGDLATDACPAGCGGGILILGAARPTVQNIALVANTAYQGGGLWVDGGPLVKLTNVSFLSNTARQAGGGLFAMPDTLLANSYFERNFSNDNGGGVHVDGAASTLTANTTDFVLNTATNGGGGAHVNGIVVLNGGRFVGNRSSVGGGLQAGSLIMTSTELISNSANFGGGGASIFGPARLYGGKFSGNFTSNGNGGGLAADALQAQFTNLVNNTATGGSIQQGGAVYLNNGPNDLDQVWFQRNEAQSNGGALYATGVTTLTGVSMISNTAYAGQGGGAFVNSPVTVLGGSYAENFADVSGGGLYALSLFVDGVHLDSNRTAGDGGALHANGGTLVLSNGALRDNIAGRNGGGVYAGGTIWITNTFFIKNSAQNGGGLYQAPAGDAHIVNALFARNQAVPGQTAAIAFAATGSFSMVHSTVVDIAPNLASAISINNGNAAADIEDSIVSNHAVGINLIVGGAYENYNLFFNNEAISSGPVTHGGNSIPNLDPQFANPLGDDYHLRFTSPAINAGINVGVNFDIDGQPRPIGPGFDIGFDETGSSIQQLIDATPPGGTVIIPAGIYTESLTLYKPVSLIGAGSGSTIIQAAPNDRVITITGNTITPSTQIADLTLLGGRRLTGGCPDACGGGVLVTNAAYPSLNNVIIKDNQAFNGGGLYIQTGGARLNNSLLALNHATQSGGGAYVEAASARLEQIGGAVSDNMAVDGAGVFVQAGEFQASGGAIFNNQATNWGGGLLVGGGGSLKTNLTQIFNNGALNAGGALLVDVGQAEVVSSLIMSNTAQEGGGVYVRDMTGTSAALVGGKVESNLANAYGGGVYAAGTLYITGTRFFDNRAYDGGALEITGTARARVVNAFMAGNEAYGAFPSTNASVRFDSSANSVVLHTTFGNPTQPLTRALAVNSGVVTVANTIVASYTNGLSQFGGQLAEDYNLFYGTPITGSGSINHGGHSLVGLDPMFKGAASGDYHLKGLSPAVNRGTNVGLRRDIDGEARPLGGGFDIGADEASVASVLPGPDTGGQFIYTTTQNSTIFLDVPPGAVTQTVPIYCSLIDATMVQPPRSFKFAGIVFEIDADLDPVNVLPGSINFNVPVTLSLGYTDEQLAAAGITDELSLKLYRFEPLLGEWRPIGYRPAETQTLDVDNNLITATVLGFSRFGGMGQVAAGFEIFLPLVMKN